MCFWNCITYCKEKNAITKNHTNKNLFLNTVAYYKKLNNQHAPEIINDFKNKNLEGEYLQPYPIYSSKTITLNNLLAATIDEFDTIEILVNGFRQIE